MTIKEDKDVGNYINKNILEGINKVTHYCVLNIYPKGQFGAVKLSEQVEFWDIMAGILNVHGFYISKNQVNPAIKYKKEAIKYSQFNDTQPLTEEKYIKIQKNLDGFIKFLKLVQK